MVVKGTLIHTPKLGEVEIIEDALVAIDDSGQISSVLAPGSADYANDVNAASAKSELFELTSDQYLLPGLVDLHVHAPQWPQLGKALHLPLYDWLQQCTFPLEARYDDLDFARVGQELRLTADPRTNTMIAAGAEVDLEWLKNSCTRWTRKRRKNA